MYYYMNGRRKMNVGSSMPTFILDYERGLKGLFGSNDEHERVEFDVQQKIKLTLKNAVLQATKNANQKYPDLPVVFSGGVASNSMLRQEFSGTDAVFALPQFSTDNAMGVAVLTQRLLEG